MIEKTRWPQNDDGTRNNRNRPLGLSVVVPLSRQERSWRGLCSCLLFLPGQSEIIFVSPQKLQQQEAGYLSLLRKKYSVHWLTGGTGRASRMNLGASRAEHDFLWFLHADSRFLPKAVDALLRSVSEAPQALHYFDLAFLSDGPALSQLNGIMANIRSRRLGMPFGDQGFCLAAEIFQRLGGFDVRCPFGEDHDLVWRARLDGIFLKPTGQTIWTSARKYADKGWFKTTAEHVIKSWTQALPLFVRVQRQKLEHYFEL